VQEAEQVFISETRATAIDKFNSFVTDHNSQAGLQTSPILLGGFDIWVQDAFEPGYVSMPGPDGPITIRIMLLSHQRRGTGDSIFKSVRNDNIGAINFPEVWSTDTSQWGGTWDSTGNLETIPPYSHGGKDYPAGRIIMGQGEEGLPLILPFLELQETQDPLVLDTTFLAVGHVDEFIQFLPANNSRGWVIMADDPLAGMALLKNAAAAGHGSKRAISRPINSWDPYSGVTPPCVPRSTINYELARADFEKTQKYAAEQIQANINIIKEQTGITDAEIFRVPGLWSADWRGWNCNNDGGGAKVASAKFSKPKPEDVFEPVDIVTAAGGDANAIKSRQSIVKVHAHYPSAVNGVVLSNSYYLAPNPWGPIIDGVDIFAQAIKAAYAPLGFTVNFIDTWFTHHQGKGEVHCGTNVWREPNPTWW
jgi:protein-arginine deiminase